MAIIPNPMIPARTLLLIDSAPRVAPMFFCSTIFIGNQGHVEVGDVDVTLRKNIRVHGATDSVVTLATFG